MKLSLSLKENINTLKNILSGCDDVIFRKFYSADHNNTPCVLIFSDGMCDKDLISDRVLEKIMASGFIIPENEKFPPDETSPEKIINVIDYDIGYDTDSAVSAVLSGNAAILIDGKKFFINIASTKFTSRSITEPQSKSVIRGPRDGFTENFLDSTSLLRRRLKTADFKMEFITAGKSSPSRIAVCYMDDRVNKNRLGEVKDILSSVNADIVIDSGQIQNILMGGKDRLISDIQATERVDDAVFAIGEGKIVILVENSPFVLIIPGLLLSMLTSSEDYYSTKIKRNALLFLRIISCITTILLPAIYIGFIKFNPDFLPDKIILMLSQARKNVALPPFTEILFMQLVFEIIMEAAIRLPKQIASTVGIVGSIVVGQAIVDANLVNIMVVIIVAINAILTFVIPSFELSKTLRFLRILFMLAGAALGIFGVVLSFVILMIHLSSMSSFGSDFLFPFVESRGIKKER